MSRGKENEVLNQTFKRKLIKIIVNDIQTYKVKSPKSDVKMDTTSKMDASIVKEHFWSRTVKDEAKLINLTWFKMDEQKTRRYEIKTIKFYFPIKKGHIE